MNYSALLLAWFEDSFSVPAPPDCFYNWEVKDRISYIKEHGVFYNLDKYLRRVNQTYICAVWVMLKHNRLV